MSAGPDKIGLRMENRAILLVVLALLLVPVNASRPGGAGDEVRGLWVVRTTLRSPESIDRLVEEASAAGFNTLLVQVRGRGDALYRSQYVPRSESLQGQPDSFDPLAYTLEKARRRGISVHAWVNTLLLAGYADKPSSPMHLLKTHVDWLSVPQSLAGRKLDRMSRPLDRLRTASRKYGSEIEGFFLDPGEPGVEGHLRKLVVEIVSTYGVDGVHLDYLRYPHAAFGYSPRVLEEFKNEIEKQISSKQRQRLRNKLAKDPSIYARSYPAAWANFRRRQVTELLTGLNRAIKAASQASVVSVAVVADSDTARNSRLQDWKLWLEQDLLDAVCPMAYSPDTETFKTQVAIAHGFSFGRAVWAGIGAWKMALPDIFQKIEVSRKIGTQGFILFSYDGLIAESSVNPGGRNLRRMGSLLNEDQASYPDVTSSR